MKQFHLHELVQSPTRVTATTTSQLDLILTNIPSFFRIRLPFHLAGVIIINVLTRFCARGISQSSDCKVVYSRCYSKLDKDMLDKILLDDSWDEIFSVDDINVCAEAFTLVMQHILDVMIPLKKMRIKQACSPWSYDADITFVRHQRDCMVTS